MKIYKKLTRNWGVLNFKKTNPNPTSQDSPIIKRNPLSFIVPWQMEGVKEEQDVHSSKDTVQIPPIPIF